MEKKEMKTELRKLIATEHQNAKALKEKDAEWTALCRESSNPYRGARYDAYREKWKHLPYRSGFYMSGINPVAFGGPEFDYITGLYAAIAYLRGKQHITRARIAGTFETQYQLYDGSTKKTHEYKGDGVMVTVGVTPEMYKEFCEKVLAKVFPLPPPPKPVDKPARALSLFARELETKGVEGIPFK